MADDKIIIGYDSEEAFRRVANATKRVERERRAPGKSHRANPPIMSPGNPDDISGNSSGSGCACCNPHNCSDPGVGVACEICDCSGNPWIAYLPTINCTPGEAIEGGGGTVVGGWRALFFDADASGDGDEACIWQTGEFETGDPARTFNWKMTVLADKTALLQLIEIFSEEDFSSVLGEWTCDAFCCRCENTFTAGCPAYIPVPCNGFPASVCVTPVGTYRNVVSGCETLLLDDLAFCQATGVAKFWFANLDGFADCNCGVTEWCDALAGDQLLITIDDDCEYTGTTLYAVGDEIHPYSIIVGFTWDGTDLTVTFYFNCDSVTGQLTYKTSGGFNCLDDNTLNKVGWSGTELFDTVPDTITLEPAGILTDANGDPILDANGNTIFEFDQDTTECDEPEDGCCAFYRIWEDGPTGLLAGGTPADPDVASWRWLLSIAPAECSNPCGSSDPFYEDMDLCDLASLPDPAVEANGPYFVTGCAP